MSVVGDVLLSQGFSPSVLQAGAAEGAADRPNTQRHSPRCHACCRPRLAPHIHTPCPSLSTHTCVLYLPLLDPLCIVPPRLLVLLLPPPFNPPCSKVWCCRPACLAAT